jgi:hypothetical protein
MTTRLAFVHVGAYRRFAGEPVRVSKALLAAIVIAIATPAVSGDSGAPAAGTVTARERMVGQFTGKFVNGTPVYRLPSIRVSVSRTAELARIEREERLTHAGATRARTAGRPPA